MLTRVSRGSRPLYVARNLFKPTLYASFTDLSSNGYRILQIAQAQHISKRSVVFARTHKKTKRHGTTKAILRPRNENFKNVEQELGLKLENLTKLTRQVKSIIRKQKEEETVDKAKKLWKVNEIDFDKGVIEDADALFKALADSRNPSSSHNPQLLDEASSGNSEIGSDKEHIDDLADWTDLESTMSIFPKVQSYVQLPTSVTDQLDDITLQYVASKKTANWIPVIDKLFEKPNCLEKSSSYEAHVLLKSIPKIQRPAIIDKFYSIVKQSGLLNNRYLYNDIISCYNTIDVKRSKPIIERLYKEMTVEKEIKPDKFTIGVMVNMYSKDRNVNGVRMILHKMEQLKEHPNSKIYTSILQMYIRMNEYESAKEIFDTMKFLSLQTAPTSRTFSSMILLDTLHDNIEHGIALYDEMRARNVKIEAQALLALAKGCSTRRNLIHQGWSFILEYYSLGYPASYKLMEIMLSLSAKDSDLNFARALYLNIFETNTKSRHGVLTPASATSFKYLLNAYYYFREDAIPSSTTDTRIRAIKASSLDLMSFDFSDEAPPMLPVKDLSFAKNKDAIFEEARALFNYHMLVFPGIVSEQIMEAYLFVLAVHSNEKKFLQVWNKYTYLENIDSDQEVIVEEPHDKVEEELQKDVEMSDDDEIKVPVEQKLKKPPKRFPRTDRLYNACLHAARNYKDVKFAQDIWIERGKYRKTSAFQKLDPYIQDQLDFKFARAMLSCLVETGNAVDAYQLVLSSQNRFVWTYYHLKSLISLCERSVSYTHLTLPTILLV